MEYREKFAQRLVYLREQKGISQQELADNLNITRQSLSLYEKAERTINIELLAKIADFFNVSTDYLMGRTDTATMNEDLQTACRVTGLGDHDVLRIQMFGKYYKKEFSDLISFEEFEEILLYLDIIKKITFDRKVFQFLDNNILFIDGTDKKTIWDKINISEDEDYYIYNKCTDFIYKNYCREINALGCLSEECYNSEIDLSHFRLTKLLSKFVSSYEEQEINSKTIIIELIDYLKKEIFKNIKHHCEDRNNCLLQFIGVLENHFIKGV